jgi:lipid-A-disaccharide synthase
MKKTLRIGIVAGELSGDNLGAGLMQAIQMRYPDARFEGIGGTQMLARGFHSHYPLETLSVMGLFEVLRHYPRLKRCHNWLIKHFLSNPPDVFIGIDAPDFNLPLELPLRQAGIRTVHYVSPSVWAWREGRLKKIAQACDLMLTLLPFEADYYANKHIPVCYVGHPLARRFPRQPDTEGARSALGLTPPTAGRGCYIALLPGSRRSEVSRLSAPFIATACQLLKRRPDLQFIAPMANQSCRDIFSASLEQYPEAPPIQLIDGQAQTVMTAADVALTASGTATLEVLLCKKPMVIAYKLAPLTFAIAKRLVKVRWVGLPNLLANQTLVPEFIQDKATPEAMATALIHWLENPQALVALQSHYAKIHEILDAGGSEKAAEAVLGLVAT